MNAATRRIIGLAAWIGLGVATVVWVLGATQSVHWSIWAVLSPWPLLLPGLLKPSRNAWLLALLVTIGFVALGVMDAVANPDSFAPAAVMGGTAMLAFFLLLPAIRTLPETPR